MTELEYRDELVKLEEEYRKKRLVLMAKFATENNTVKKGDKFTDHIGTIIVEEIKTIPSLTGLPSCIYFGIELKKDGKPKKNNDKRWAYQSNQIKQ
jgi:hypothetical protein